MSEESNQAKIPAYVVQRDSQYSVECQIKMAAGCQKNGEYCDGPGEAEDWVEEECWIFSGEGWICVACTEHIVMNLAKTRKRKGLDGKDDDLGVGIDTVR